MRILHLSADYPDPLASTKTRAVANLLAACRSHEHNVWSLNRVGAKHGVRALPFSDAGGEGHRAVAYGAPARGVCLAGRLKHLAAWLGEEIERAGEAPDLVHAHKLSVEGIVGEILANHFGAPLAISVQGNTDLKIVKARPDLRETYRRLWRDAAVAFPFAPWAQVQLDAVLGARKGATRPLPCPILADTIRPPKIVGPTFRSAFNLRDARNKNATVLIEAVRRCAPSIPDIRLEIIGGGDAAEYARLVSFAEKTAPGRVRLVGTVPNSDMQGMFNNACAMALTSRRESFGMVFSEALLAGCPCLFPRGRAIDGYFEEGSVVLGAEPDDVDEISAALERFARQEQEFKARLATLAESGGLDFLRCEAIVAAYEAGVESAVAQRAA